jgi:hypothetical protein
LPAIAGHVPNRMVMCMAAFFDFCYLARLSSHDVHALQKMEEALARFQDLREIFRTEDVRDGFALPRQHALVHYSHSIRLFGSPNGLCSSITESKHIRAVKEPWRRSNRNNPLQQILVINTRMSKLNALSSYLGSRGLLDEDVYSARVRDITSNSATSSSLNDSIDKGTPTELESNISQELKAFEDDTLDLSGEFELPAVQLAKRASM